MTVMKIDSTNTQGISLAYLASGTPVTVANTTTVTSLVPSIVPFSVAAQNLGNIVNISLDGTVSFAVLANYVTFIWSIGSTTLATHTIAGTDLTAAAINTIYQWSFTGKIVTQSTTGSSATVALIGILEVITPGDVLSISINSSTTLSTSVQNSFNVTVGWNTAATN